ncbi:MAG TPA: hypothetical protein EYP21_10650, partial [Syntrophaceae bacterium]|nr:hypothetical protein [Syntrophaceae bacterium]
AVAIEAALQKVMRRDITIMDGSAVLMGLLFACILPPTAPWWLIILGVGVGMVAGKHIYGGLGSNPFNPVLVGWAALRLSFSAHLDRSATPLGVLKYHGVDAVLAKFKYMDLMVGNTPGSIGEVCAIGILIGGLFLLWRGYITWHIPVSFLANAAVFGAVFWKPALMWKIALILLVIGIAYFIWRRTSLVLIILMLIAMGFAYLLKSMGANLEELGGAGAANPLFHLFAGGMMLGAFFLATDMVTTPVTGTGMLVFGLGCGMLTMVARLWGSWVEPMLFAILVMNGFSPLIDRYIRVAPFGRVKASA